MTTMIDIIACQGSKKLHACSPRGNVTLCGRPREFFRDRATVPLGEVECLICLAWLKRNSPPIVVLEVIE